MRLATLPAAALIATLAFAAVPVLPRVAEAGTGVVRCERPDGTFVYSNRSCSQFGAASSPISADLASRIVSERRAEVRTAALRSGMDPAQAIATLETASVRASAAPGLRRAAAAGCARSPQQLAQDLRASVAIGDVNRVAESFDWAGMQSRTAHRVMNQLAGLADRSILETEYFDATRSARDPEVMASGVLQVTFRGEGGMTIDDFAVTRHSGCYFLRYA